MFYLSQEQKNKVIDLNQLNQDYSQDEWDLNYGNLNNFFQSLEKYYEQKGKHNLNLENIFDVFQILKEPQKEQFIKIIEFLLGAILESDLKKEAYIKSILDLESEEQNIMIQIIQRVIGDPSQPKLSKSISERYFDLNKFNDLLPKLDELERENSNLTQLLDQVQKEQLRLQGKNESLEKLVNQKEKELEKMHQNYDEILKDTGLHDWEDVSQELKKRNAMIEQLNKYLESLRQNQEQARINFECQIQELKEQTKQMVKYRNIEEKYEQINREYLNLKQKNDYNNNLIEELNNEIKEKDKKIENQKIKIENFKGKLEREKSDGVNLQIEIDKKSNEIIFMQREMESLKTQREELVNNISQLQEKMGNLNQEYNRRSSQQSQSPFTETLGQQIQEAEENQKENKNQSKFKQVKVKKFDPCQNILSNLDSQNSLENKQNQDDYDFEEMDEQECRQNFIDLRNQMEMQNFEINQLRDKVVELVKENSSLKFQGDSNVVRVQIQKLQREKEFQKNQFQEQINQKEEELKIIIQVLEEIRQRYIELQSKIKKNNLNND